MVTLVSPSEISRNDDWQNGKTLKEANLYMLRHELGCDVKFLVGQGREEVRAHRFVLISKSPLLERMFFDHTEDDHLAVNVTDVTVATFRDVLTYMYTGSIEIDGKNATAVLYAARRLQVQALMNRCFDFFNDSMNLANVSKILEQAHIYKETNLYDKCVKFILTHAKDVIRTRAFSELCRECLKAIIGADDLRAEEHVVFEAMMDWATCECRRQKLAVTDANRRKVLGDLLYLIRFPTMDVTYFTQRVSFRDILTDDEAVSVYQYFHGEQRRLPNNFITQERKRLQTKRPSTVQQYVPTNNVDFMTPAQFIESRRMQRESPTLWNTVTPTFRNFSPSLGNVKSVNMQPSPPPPKPQLTPVIMDIHQTPNLCRVSRFLTFGGQWKQNGPADAISFSCSSPIVLYGCEIYGVYTGQETYRVKVYLYDDTKQEIRKDEMNVATNELRRTYDVTFSRPVRIPPKRVFTVMIMMNGSPCHKGVEGSILQTYNGVNFEFSNSNRSSNGTDITVGQIPALLFNRTE